MLASEPLAETNVSITVVFHASYGRVVARAYSRIKVFSGQLLLSAQKRHHRCSVGRFRFPLACFLFKDFGRTIT